MLKNKCLTGHVSLCPSGIINYYGYLANAIKTVRMTIRLYPYYKSRSVFRLDF